MRLVLALSAALFLLPAFHLQAQSPADEKAVREVLARETDGWNTFDPKKVISAYTDNIIWQNPFGVRLHGKPEVEKFLTDLLARPGYRAGSSTTPITILDLRFTSPTTAAVWSDERIDGLINDLSGNPMQPRHSFYLKVLVKKHGAWKISDFLVMDIVHPK
jgi:uncharacterized protein (TIGR02246 family)